MMKLIRSFSYALKGFAVAFRQRNFRIHVTCAILAVFLGFFLHISTLEWVAVLLCIGIVISLEIINTAIESITDWISPGHHSNAANIKDLAAAAVLVTAFISLIIGGIIFGPKLYQLFN